MKKHLLGILMAMALCLCLLTVTASAAELASGICGGEGDGSNLTWVLTDDGTLTISGTGAMTNWDDSNVPWYSLRDDIKTVVIEAGVTSIGDNAFYGCGNLTSLTIGSNVASIGNYAFSSCYTLPSVAIPDSVSSIGAEAFSMCSGLTSVTIGSGVTSIGKYAFLDNLVQVEFIVSGSNQSFSSQDGVLFNKAKTKLIAYPKGKTGTEYAIPDGVTTVGEAAFFSCGPLNSVTFPKSVTSIETSAFYYCSNLTSIRFEGSAPTITSNAFTSVTATCYYPATDNSWTSSAKQNYGGTLTWQYYYPSSGTCGSNLTWELSDGTLTISGTGAMANWSAMSAPWYSHNADILAVVIDNGVTSIGNNAFAYCKNLANVTIGSGVSTIGKDAFVFCSSLTSISLGNGVTSIGAGAFSDCGSLTSVTLGDSVASIGEGAFAGCSELTSISIPNSVVTIGDYAFSSCNLINAVIPDGVNSIGEYAFAYNNNLNGVTIGNGVTTIGAYAFEYCYELTNVTIGSGVASIGVSAFHFCPKLTEIAVSDSNPNYSSLDGVLFNKGKTTIHSYPEGKTATTYTIPDSVTTIDNSAFRYCKNLTSITFEGSAPSIGSNAFSGVNNLICYYPATDDSWTVNMQQNYGGTLTWNIYYPTSGVCGENLTWVLSNDGTLTVSGTGAMANWTYSTDVPWYGLRDDIKAVVIEDGVTSISDSAFYYCEYLTSVAIGGDVTTIGDYAFLFCDKLTGVTIPDSVISIGEEAFSGCSELASVSFGSGVKTIGGAAFTDCPSLTNVTIPGNVTTIGNAAFSYCRGLTDVSISDGVTTIGINAFYSCEDLTSVTIPASVTTIGSGAFSGCISVTKFVVDGNNLHFIASDGVLFNKAKTQLIAYPAGKAGSTYAIPNSVIIIGEYAFGDCSNLTAVTIPDSVTTIGKYAFYSCSNLSAVTIPGSVTSIGEYAFFSCSKLKTVSFEGSAPVFGSNAFSGVTATCYYPASNPTWTDGKRVSYGGTLTWTGTGAVGYEPAVLKNGYYEISNASQLLWFADYVNAGNTAANGRLTANIVLNNGDVIGCSTYTEKTDFLYWTPIATGSTYSGIFDGNGHSISGLYYFCNDATQAQERGSFGGLFYDVSGTICNLTIENSFFYHYNYAAAICHTNTGKIQNCSVTANVLTKSNTYRSGVAYQNAKSGSIENCQFRGRGAANGICSSNSGTITGCSNYANSVKSGICGSNSGTISKCVNCGTLGGYSSDSVGGICSWNGGTISDCTNAGEINGSSMQTGGIAGSNDGTILRCANTATVYSSSTYTGGICGSNYGGKVVGGIVKACYNTDAVSSSREFCGGIVGSNSGLVTGCYNTGRTGGLSGTSGSICGQNNVQSSQGYSTVGAVTYCISYHSNTIIGQSVTGSIANYNFTQSGLSTISPAYLMNGFTSAGDVDWYQNIDNGQPADTYAVWDSSHGKVYRSGNSAYTNTPQPVVKAGSCGDNLEWTLDENGTLTISGSGSMDSFTPGGAPWYPWRDEIRSVIFAESRSISSVGSYAFYNCAALTHVDLGVWVDSIGSRAFANCTALQEFYYGVYSPSSASIGSLAFYGCSALETLSVPVPTAIATYAFEGCTALDSIYINYYSGYAPSITAAENAFTGVNATVYYPQGMSQPSFGSAHGGTLQFANVPYGTCGLDTQWAFDAASGTLTLSGSGVPQEYFAGHWTPWTGLMDSITTVVVNKGITGISNHLFEFLEKAETISLPDGLKTLPYTAFNNCYLLNNLLIPASVVSMGNDVGFTRCSSLTDVYYVGTAEDWAKVAYSDSFRSCFESAKTTLHCLTLQENPPTCTENGTESYYAFDNRTVYSAMYDENKQVITQLEIIPATNHVNKHAGVAKDPTCTESGNTAGVYCPDCDTWLTEQETIPELDHIDENADHICDRSCGKTDIGDHADANSDHKCDYGCSVRIGTCADTNNDHKCDYGCGAVLSDCVDGDDIDHKCDICGKDNISEHSFTENLVSETHLKTAATCENAAVYYISCVCGEHGSETFTFGSAKGHDKSYQVIDDELYYACSNCDDRVIARSVEWNGQYVSVKMEAVLQPTLLYGALYDSNGCMIEVRIVEVTDTETQMSFDKTASANRIKLFFIGIDKNPQPWLRAVELTKI